MSRTPWAMRPTDWFWLLGWRILKEAICTRIALLWISASNWTAWSLIWRSQLKRQKVYVCHEHLKGGPEPLDKEFNEILGSKREDRHSDPFFELVQKTCQVLFPYLLRLCNLCKAPRDMRKFPQKCQKIAGCWGRGVYVHTFRSLRHLAHALRNEAV